MKLDLFTLLRIKKILFPFFQKKRQKGMALIMVLSSIVFILVFVQETVFETQVEYRSAINELNSLRAYHAAKSGVEVSLLRLKTYTKITQAHTQQIKMFRSYIDLIWRFPFIWPPPTPAEINSIDNKQFTKIQKESFMQTHFMTSIEPESGRIDINDLASPIPSLRAWTLLTLIRLINYLKLTNKALSDEFSDDQVNQVLLNITDWIDPNTQINRQSNLSEGTLYENNISPPNRSLISLEELRQVKGMSDTLYEALTPFLTIYGEKGLNINSAPLELLMALHNEFPPELAREIYEMTSSNPLSPFVFTKESFSKFLTERGFEDLEQYFFPDDTNDTVAGADITEDIEEDTLQNITPYINFNAPHHFRIKSTGIAGNSQKTITATYFDASFSNKLFNSLMKKEEKQEIKKIKKKLAENEVLIGGEETEDTKKDTNKTTDTPSGLGQNLAPLIIYWKESF